MELRYILILLALLVIALIIADGVRRLRKRPAPAPVVARPVPAGRREETDFNPELPSGGARVIQRARIAPTVGDAGSADVPSPVAGPRLAAEPPSEPPPPRKVEQVDMFGDAPPAAPREARERGALPRRPAEPGRDAGTSIPRNEAPAKPKRDAPEEVIVLHVMGGNQRLPGKALMQAVLDCGMRWGEYRIWHRYESAAHDALAIFSMASAVEPGTFDIEVMETQDFVGVSFFLMLPGPANSRQALDMMIEAARRVARDTGGELHDQQHSALTLQTIEHLRQRVMEFERRRLAQQRGGA